jgi:integrase/recombinase XerC
MPQMLIWRRHTAKCPHLHKGREFLKCSCPLWADGYSNGKRTYRVSLKTRDMSRGLKRAAELDAPGAPMFEPLKSAVKTFMDHCADLQGSTRRKYQNSLDQLVEFALGQKIDTVSDMTIDLLESFRAGRKISPITNSKELQTFRQFFGFCFDRRWIAENVAKRVKGPRNIRPNDIEPYTSGEVAKILAACDTFGRGPYERARARGMVLLLRYTALRIGDVAMLARDRVSWDAERERWRVFIRTEKTGAPVFLPIPSELKQALDALPHPRLAEAEPKHFFWNGTTGKRAAVGGAERALSAVFKKSGVTDAHAHRFRHTLATELLGRGASFEDIADILGNSPVIVRKHYGKWSPARQSRIDSLMDSIVVGTNWAQTKKTAVTN